MDEFSPNRFEDVFSAELEEIAKRQEKPNGEAVDRKELAGIALSGGGIRAATSALGVLQALKKLGVLPVFDYLSTVSGGGFTGGWWSAWCSRPFDPNTPKEDKFFPPPERIQPERDQWARQAERNQNNGGASPASNPPEPQRTIDPVHHLRLFSNYLTPMKGFMSADTWRANAVISRNLGLTWLVLIPMIFAAVLLAQSYFTIQPNSEMEFLYPYSHFAKDSVQATNIQLEMEVMSSLDSMVHGSKSVISLEPVQKIRELSAPTTPDSSYAQLLRRINSMQYVDSAIAAEGGETQFNPKLQNRIDTIEAGVIEWHKKDSTLRANPMLTPAAREESEAAIQASYKAKLDPLVDSVRARLGKMQVRLMAHRVEEREKGLFNETHLRYLAHRAVWGSFLPVMMIGWIVMLICLWLINSNHRMFGGNVLQATYAFICGLAAYILVSMLIGNALGTVGPDGWNLYDSSPWILTWSVVALLLLSLLLWDDAHWFWKTQRKSASSGTIADAASQQLLKLLEVRRSRIVTYHQRLLMGAFLATVLLAFGGFGHEVINYLFFYHTNNSEDVWQWLARSSGMITVLIALTGTGLAARNASPVSNRGEAKPPGKIKSMLISLAPPLILGLLLCGISWAGHWVLQALVFQGGSNSDQNYMPLVFAMLMLGFVSLYYAVFDLHFRARRSKRVRQARQFSRLLLFGVFLVQIAMMAAILVDPTERMYSVEGWWIVSVPIVMWGIIFWKYWWEQKNPQPMAKSPSTSHPELQGGLATERPRSIGARIRTILSASAASLVVLALSTLLVLLTSIFESAAELPINHLFAVGLGASILILLLDLLWGIRAPEDGRRGNHEARVLLGINITLFSLFLLIPPLAESPHWGLTHILEVLLSLSIGGVIFVGWRIDPNTLSIHEFYRNRIVRAYLGASNWLRNISSKMRAPNTAAAHATQVHPEDDIALSALNGCGHGAPYHLVNATLNLLGTKSLETAQRHASNFILSKRYCGSVTTGYRATTDYMSGTMTLGTAVAISGAAASPNMGSNQVSGATTMLMSLLNVRLGYWAANPGRSRWREAQPKLWPYYLLKETLSQTSGFGAFCYLTDGGHFDNTGLYPLIERGCRYIVLCDNGADPLAHFKDLGNALRRCRIDFGAEFALDGLKEMTSLGGPSTSGDAGKAHWLRGTVKYSEAHLRTLWGEKWDEGLSPEERSKYRTGVIVVLKPTLLGDEPVDVLQYGLQYADFPQQSTANQWFSEDQFESYRRLGYWSAQTAFGGSDLSNASRAEQLQAITGTART